MAENPSAGFGDLAALFGNNPFSGITKSFQQFQRGTEQLMTTMDNLNKTLMTFASYNAGPGRLRQLRREAAQRGLNPNVWFGNVERVASERIGRETVTYVSNIYKYYITYRLLSDQLERRNAAKAAVRKTGE